MALRAAGGWSVRGWDCDAAAGQEAVRRGALDSVCKTAPEAVSAAQLVILAVPVSRTLPLLESIAGSLADGAVVTDAGSTKGRIVEAAQALLGGRFVGGHPMAGSERSGIAAADGNILREATWFLTPTSSTDPQALQLAVRMVRACGAFPRFCAPGEHDRLAAVLSHLPHLLAYGLAQAAADSVPPEWRNAAGGSFRDGTRVASSAADLWAEILIDNRASVLDSLNAHHEWISRAKAVLEANDLNTLRALLSDAREARAHFPSQEPNTPS